MQDDGKVFSCYVNMWDTIFYSELGSSLAILRGGYNLDSFMVRYQNVDWTNEANWECNSRCAALRRLLFLLSRTQLAGQLHGALPVCGLDQRGQPGVQLQVALTV